MKCTAFLSSPFVTSRAGRGAAQEMGLYTHPLLTKFSRGEKAFHTDDITSKNNSKIMIKAKAPGRSIFLL